MIKKIKYLINFGILIVLLLTNFSTVTSLSLDEIKEIYDIPDDAEILHYDEYYVAYWILDHENCTANAFVIIVLIPGTIVYVKINGGETQICKSYCEYPLSGGSHVITYWARLPDGNEESQHTTPTIYVDCEAPTVTITKPEDGLYFNDVKLIDLNNSVVVGPITIVASASDAGGVQMVLFELSNGETHYDTTAPYEFYYSTRYFGKITVNITAIDQVWLEATSSMSFFKIF